MEAIPAINASLPAKHSLEIVAISDTHGSLKMLQSLYDHEGDIFIHGGDFTNYGKEKDFLSFFDALEKLKFRNKIVISGNHEIMLDNGHIDPKLKREYLRRYPCSFTHEQLKHELQKRCIYLQHQFVSIDGVRIFASPYTPFYCGSAFQYTEKYEQIIWGEIPHGLDLLVTHGPPNHILDQNSEGVHAGSEVLRKIVIDRKPKYHIFGHIHESAGMQKVGDTVFLNVANTPTRIVL